MLTCGYSIEMETGLWASIWGEVDMAPPEEEVELDESPENLS